MHLLDTLCVLQSAPKILRGIGTPSAQGRIHTEL